MTNSKKTILYVEATDKVFNIKYSGAIDYPEDPKEQKRAFKHDERILLMLASDKKAFDLFYRLVEPAIRYYRREARKAAKAKSKAN